MNKELKAAIEGVVLRTYENWNTLKPLKSKQIETKLTKGKQFHIKRITNHNTGSIQVIIEHFEGVIDITFLRYPYNDVKHIQFNVMHYGKVIHQVYMEIPKNTRKVAVIKNIKKNLMEGLDKYPETQPLINIDYFQ